MEILSADLRHLSQLVELRLTFCRETFGAFSPDTEALLRQRLPAYFRSHLNHELFVFAAEEQGVLVSCAFLLVTLKPPSPKFPSGKVGTVFNVYTSPAYRRQGLALRLMELVMKKAAELSLDFVELKATKAGYVLYQKAGFSSEYSPYIPMRCTLF